MQKYTQYATPQVVDKFADVGVFLDNVRESCDLIVDYDSNEQTLIRKQLVGTALELYEESEIVNLHILRGWFGIQSSQEIADFAKRVGVMVKPKKRGRKDRSLEVQIVKKIMEKWQSPKVKALVLKLKEGYRKQFLDFRQTFEEWVPEKTTHKIYGYNPEYLEFLKPLCDDKEKLTNSLRRVDLYFFAKAADLHEDAEYIASCFEGLDYFFYEKNILDILCIYLHAEDSNRKKKLENQKKDLETTLIAQEQAAVMQIEDALTLVSERDHTIQDLQLEVEALKQRIESYKRVLNRGVSDFELLLNKKILVVGHPVQKDMYEEEIILRGGVYSFVPAITDEVGFEELEGALNRCDLALYVTTYTSHSISKFIKAKSNSTVVHSLTCNGRTTFVNELNRVFKSEQTDNRELG